MNEIHRKERIFVVSIVFLLFLIVASVEVYRMSGLFAKPVVSVTVQLETKGVFYEEVLNDTRFEIGPLPLAETWYSYNGTNGGTQAGYDLDFDGKTQEFTLRNDGGSISDVTIAASDFVNADSSDYIDVAETNGYLQVYVPTDDWRNIPDYDAGDADSTKDDEELCLANDLLPLQSLTGIDFRIKIPTGTPSGNYTGQIVVTFYDNASYSPCTGVGNYVTP